eukprot:TRINITY_DN12637_c0_g2_i1.p1 TRINITY_DN12637_c0_g2~~TRINITY_DN12637_c0_g2_i1.p1  ORF type:complete len:174 (-),score=10.66 TRINITY_DN12637_c0_g2_i1:226-747(-)
MLHFPKHKMLHRSSELQSTRYSQKCTSNAKLAPASVRKDFVSSPGETGKKCLGLRTSGRNETTSNQNRWSQVFGNGDDSRRRQRRSHQRAALHRDADEDGDVFDEFKVLGMMTMTLKTIPQSKPADNPDNLRVSFAPCAKGPTLTVARPDEREPPMQSFGKLRELCSLLIPRD